MFIRVGIHAFRIEFSVSEIELLNMIAAPELETTPTLAARSFARIEKYKKYPRKRHKAIFQIQNI